MTAVDAPKELVDEQLGVGDGWTKKELKNKCSFHIY